MLTHPRSTLLVLCIIMPLHSGHVTLLRAEFQPPNLSPQSDLQCWATSRWALPQISSLEMHVFILHPTSQLYE